MRSIRAHGPSPRAYALVAFLLTTLIGVTGLADWGPPIFVETGISAAYTSIAEIGGKPAIAYLDLDRQVIMFVRAFDSLGNEWASPVQINTAGEGGHCVELIELDGFPAVAYYSEFYSEVRYVRALEKSGRSWGSPITIASFASPGWSELSIYSHLSLIALTTGPAISYYDFAAEDLKYVRSLDWSGDAWDLAIVLDAASGAGKDNSIAMIHGCPAISYSTGGSGQLRYIRAADAIGDSWSTPVTIWDSGWIATLSSDLAFVSGRPAVAMTGSVTSSGGPEIAFGAYYLRAEDAYGDAWGTIHPVHPDADSVALGWGATGLQHSLMVVDGRPLVGYLSTLGWLLGYDWAKDSEGVNWDHTFKIVDGWVEPGIGGWHSSAVIQGRGCMSYTDAITPAVKFIRTQETGDLNDDGLISAPDVRALYQIVFEYGAILYLESYPLGPISYSWDFDQDFDVDMDDVRIFAEYVIGIRDTLP